MTPQQIAQAYVQAINSPANAWGQHAHPTLGRSDYILMRLCALVGTEEGERMVDSAFAAARTAKESR